MKHSNGNVIDPSWRKTSKEMGINDSKRKASLTKRPANNGKLNKEIRTIQSDEERQEAGEGESIEGASTDDVRVPALRNLLHFLARELRGGLARFHEGRMVQVDIDICYKTVLDAVNVASKTVLEGFEGTKKVDTKTASWDLVTEYDKKTEEFLIKTLSQAFPDHKFIGEETASEIKLTNEPTWIIDPIDGTTNFVHGIPYCAISIGLAVDREVVIGIVNCPPLNQTFTAIKGRGAFLNGKPIKTSKTEEMKNAVIGFEMSLGSRPEIREVFTNRYRACVAKAQGMRSFGSAQMTLCQVAQGTLDGFQVEYLWPWDVAAGSVIITEAGGTVLDTDGSKFDCEHGRIIAAGTKKLAEEMVKVFNIEKQNS